MKKEHREAEIAAAQKLQFSVEAARTAGREATEKEMMEEVNKMGHEFVDTGYLLFRKRIQKLYPDLDISGVDDVEMEASEPPSPKPALPAKGAVVEDAVPISVVPSITLE
ncbi:hypothetical protein F0562_036168 [Nyssa sinensis]|uniref:Uncharacterized protein n=1 Tax=Nyssa sinensis TaxID=561372 RepID=A0A5J5ACY3_9ASTE|nr:hypothetical protein F0562_036168 [Nyssa sinensis]